MSLPYANRIEAGRELAQALSHLADRSDLLVLALPRGGVPVAAEVARRLDAPLDLLLVRKLGVPGREELACGAIASGGARVLNEQVVQRMGISASQIDEVEQRERAELQRREERYRQGRPVPDVAGRRVIVIDDGLATGATMRAGVQTLRQRDPAGIVIAVPVGPPDSVEGLRTEADEVVCPATPEPFAAIGQWYGDFTQVSDDEVRRILQERWEAQRESSHSENRM